MSPSRQIELLRRSRPRQLRIETRLAPELYDKLTFLDSIKSLWVKTKRFLFFDYDYEQKTNFESFEFDHFDHFNSLLELKNLESIHMVPIDFMCKMVKLPFLRKFQLESRSTFKLSIVKIK